MTRPVDMGATMLGWIVRGWCRYQSLVMKTRQSHAPECMVMGRGVHMSCSYPFPLPKNEKNVRRVVYALLIPTK